MSNTVSKRGKELGMNIREARLKAGMSQNDVAALCGVPKERQSRYENGWIIPTIETIELLANAIGVSPKRLVGWK